MMQLSLPDDLDVSEQVAHWPPKSAELLGY